jgi:hypothetical protein
VEAREESFNRLMLIGRITHIAEPTLICCG